MKKRLFITIISFTNIAYAQIGINTTSPTEIFDTNGTLRIRELPKNGDLNAIYTNPDGSKAENKNQTFNAVNTVVVDQNGILGIIEGLPNSNNNNIDPFQSTVSYKVKTTTIDNNTPKNSLLTIGNIGIYFNAQLNSTAAYVKFCLLNGISDNVVVDQLKMGSGGLYGGNQTFLSVTSNPYTNIIESIPPFNSNTEAP